MSDMELVEKAISGDKESFKKLLDPIKNSLYKVAFVYLKNEEDALDCVHDAIIKAIKSLKKIKEPQYFNTWITRITINVCKDYLKKKSKEVIVDIDECECDFVTEGFEIEEQEEIQISRSLKKLRVYMGEV